MMTLRRPPKGIVMDPQACFESFCAACCEGDYDTASIHQDGYRAWIVRGGFPARTEDDECVTILDLEQDRYGIVTSRAHMLTDAGTPAVEKWRAV